MGWKVVYQFQKQGKVKRYSELELEYMDEDGNKNEIIASEFLATVIQHELDHLDGILYSDRAEEMFDLDDLEDISEEE